MEVICMEYTNFQVGEKFPLPIKNQGDGGLFQIDANGCMFILQLSKTDVIATEAFRTGKLELGLYEQDGILFLLYKIDGIFKEGWGDCPLGVQLLPPGLKPILEDLQEPVLHMYLVDTNLQILLAQRTVELSEEFFSQLRTSVKAQLESSLTPGAFVTALQKIWGQYSSKDMSENLIVHQSVEMKIPPFPLRH